MNIFVFVSLLWLVLGVFTFKVWTIRHKPIFQKDRWTALKQWEVAGWQFESNGDVWYKIKTAFYLCLGLWPLIWIGFFFLNLHKVVLGMGKLVLPPECHFESEQPKPADPVMDAAQQEVNTIAPDA